MNNNIIKVQIHQLLQYLFQLNIYCNQQIFNRLYLPANSVLLERESTHTFKQKPQPFFRRSKKYKKYSKDRKIWVLSGNSYLSVFCYF